MYKRRGRPPKKRAQAKQAPVEAGKGVAANGMRQWSLRFKRGNHPAESGLILASSFNQAEAVGRAWCLREGAGRMAGIRYIGVSDPILADEGILGEPG